MRLAGYACRAAYWSVGPPHGNANDLAAELALTSAGFGISIAVQTLMMGEGRTMGEFFWILVWRVHECPCVCVTVGGFLGGGRVRQIVCVSESGH